MPLSSARRPEVAGLHVGHPLLDHQSPSNELVQGQLRLGLEVALAAPTGRAAKRMSELTGMEAQTVHRLLGMSWNEDARQVTFTKTEKEPLEANAVIVDETSMVDVTLFAALLRVFPGRQLHGLALLGGIGDALGPFQLVHRPPGGDPALRRGLLRGGRDRHEHGL